MIFHISQFGSFKGGIPADMDGYAATTALEVWALEWPERLTYEQAGALADETVEAVERADAALNASSH